MLNPSSVSRPSRRFVLGFIAILALFSVVRFPLLQPELSVLAIDSDQAIFGLMADEILKTGRIPIFYWGQNYLGPLSALATAGIQLILNHLGIRQAIPGFSAENYFVSPFAMSLAAAVLMGCGIAFFILGLRQVLNERTALFTGAFLALGPPPLLIASLRVRGESGFFLGGALFWAGASLLKSIASSSPPSRRVQFIVGTLAGLSLWMNQAALFVLLPILWILVASEPLYREIRATSWKGLLLLRSGVLLRSRISGAVRRPILVINGALLLNASLGLAISLAGGLDFQRGAFHIKISNGFALIKTSFVLLALIQAMIQSLYSPWGLPEALQLIRKWRWIWIPAAVAYSPVILGRVFHWYPPSYGISLNIVSIPRAFPYWTWLMKDFLPELLLGGPWWMYGGALCPLVAVICVQWPRLRAYLRLHPGRYRDEALIWGMAVVNLLFVCFSARAEEQRMYHYAFYLPVAFAAFLAEWPRWLPGRFSARVSRLVLVGILATLFVGVRAETERWRVQSHPQEELQKLQESGCEIFLSNYWDVYRLELLSGGRLKFVVHSGQDRTPERTKSRLEGAATRCTYSPGEGIRRISE